MKQNEKILVYAVTGFLVVILMIAIVFGRDGRPETIDEANGQGGDSVPRSFEDIVNQRDPAGGLAGKDSGSGNGSGNGTDSGAGEPGSAAGGTTPGVDPTLDLIQAGGQPNGPGPELDPANLGDPAGTPGAIDPLTNRPLAVNVPLQPPTAAALVTEKLGLSRREHDFRIVRARPGDSLGSLVQKWCGATEDYLDIAKGLNEELSVLRVGQEVVLPWVDDEEVLAAFEARGARPAVPVDASGGRTASNGSRSVEPAPITNAPVDSRKYKIQPGDSLWKVAEREVGLRSAPKFLEKVRALNPGLDVDRLKVGQIIVLPAKS